MYSYAKQRNRLFTEAGQVMFLNIRAKAKALISQSGALTIEKLISECSGDAWDMLACADRLVELGELREVANPHCAAAQHRIFI